MASNNPALASHIKPGGRVLLKISGEALGGPQSSGLCPDFLETLGVQVAFLFSQGLEVGLMVGGGNFFRGRQALGILNRTTADQMGMLATLLNGLALRDVFTAGGISATVMSAFEVPSMVPALSFDQADARLKQKNLVIFVGGTGSTYFTTDTGAVLRAVEMGCDVLLKGTKVDGVYNKDPKLDASAVFYPSLSYGNILERKLQVMDLTAITLAQENRLPLVVFALQSKRALQDVWEGRARFTWVGEGLREGIVEDA